MRPSSDELAALNEPQLLAGLMTEAAPANLRPSLRGARGDLPGIYNDGCHLDAAVTTPGPCTFGDPTSTTTVALFGDSHAAQWFPALAQLADQHRWRLLVLTKKGCPTASISVFSPMVNRELRECDAWRINVAARLAAEQPDLLLMSSYRYRQTGAWAGVDGNQAWQQGLSATLAAYRPLAGRVLVLGDTPTPARDIPACVSANLSRVSACVNPRAEAVRDDRLGVEQGVAAAYDAAFVSTSNWLCSPTACPVIVGDVLVYRDANHLTATAASWLAPYLDAADRAVAPVTRRRSQGAALAGVAVGLVLAGCAPAPVKVHVVGMPMVTVPARAMEVAPTTTTPPTTLPPTTTATYDATAAAHHAGPGAVRRQLRRRLPRPGHAPQRAARGAGRGRLPARVEGGVRRDADRGRRGPAGRRRRRARPTSPWSCSASTTHGRRSAEGRFPRRIDAVVQAAGPRLVVWPMLASTADCSNGYKDALVRANQELQAATLRWPNLVLADYPAFLAGHPEYSENRCPHLVPPGYGAAAAWLAGEVRRLLELRTP